MLLKMCSEEPNSLVTVQWVGCAGLLAAFITRDEDPFCDFLAMEEGFGSEGFGFRDMKGREDEELTKQVYGLNSGGVLDR